MLIYRSVHHLYIDKWFGGGDQGKTVRILGMSVIKIYFIFLNL